MILSSSPRRTMKPVPVCGARCRRLTGDGMPVIPQERSECREASRFLPVKGAPPVWFGGAARVLSRLRLLSELREIRVGRSLQGDVALAHQGAQPLELALGPQPLELSARVEHECGPPEATRQSRAHGV